MTDPLMPATSRRLTAELTRLQRSQRSPGLYGVLARRGEVLWEKGIGSADLDRPGQPHMLDTQFPVASNTKTFTAVLIMQLRDEGRLDLDDTVETLLPGSTHSGVTVGRLLSHSSGMQREPGGDVWETLEFPGREELLTHWNEAEQVLRPDLSWHYSNLGYGVLGEIIAQLDGRSWADSVQARLLDPLGLARTGVDPQPPTAGLYDVPQFSDVPVIEPVLDKSGLDSVGGLWSTAADMVAWHAFLADPDPAILAPSTMEEMRQVRVLSDPEGWTQGWGLGLQLTRLGGRTWLGHTGGLPGSITGIFTELESGTTVVLASNTSGFAAPSTAAAGLGNLLLDLEPPLPEPWEPGTELPDELAPLVGIWFSEGSGFTFSIRDGHLEAHTHDAPEAKPAVFEQTGPDAFVTVSGRERGERLEVRRREDGSVRQLNWATYRFTREPLGFAEPND